MDCMITVPGDGVGRHGHPARDVTKTVREFLVDNSVYYIAITNHLKTCDKCSIEDILRVYLSRRIPGSTSKSNSRSTKWGVTSIGLMDRSIILENLARKKGKPVPKELVNEFIWRCTPSCITAGGNPSSERIWNRLSSREKYNSFALFFNINPDFDITRIVDSSRKNDLALAKVAMSYQNQEISDSDLDNLIQVAEVVYS